MKPPPLVIAHRGASGSAPENSAAAIDAALAMGVEMIEVDVQLSRDGEVVVFHDERLERTTNGCGRVCDHDWTELAALNAGSWFSPRFCGERILRLDELLELIDGRCRLNVEIKSPAAHEDRSDRVKRIVTRALRSSMADHIIFSSFDHATLQQVGQRAPRFPRAALLPPQSDWSFSDLARHCGCTTVVCALEQLTPARLADLRQHPLSCWVYTINNKEQLKRAVAAGVAALFSDFPERMLHLLATPP